MAHELATSNGRSAMFYTGEVPWHGLGTRLDSPATAAGGHRRRRPGLRRLPRRPDHHRRHPRPPARAVVRADTRDVLGVVGTAYVPVQNRGGFGFLDAIVAEGGIRYHTAGALRKGEKIWLLGKLPGQIRVRGSDDVTEKYLLLSQLP